MPKQWETENAALKAEMAELRSLLNAPPASPYPPQGKHRGIKGGGGGGNNGQFGKGNSGMMHQAYHGGQTLADGDACQSCGRQGHAKDTCWFRTFQCHICKAVGHMQSMCRNQKALQHFQDANPTRHLPNLKQQNAGKAGGGGKTGQSRHIKGTVTAPKALAKGAVPTPVVPNAPAFVSWLCPVLTCRAAGGTQQSWATHCQDCGIKRPAASTERAKKEAAAQKTALGTVTSLPPKVEAVCAELLDEEADTDEQFGGADSGEEHDNDEEEEEDDEPEDQIKYDKLKKLLEDMEGSGCYTEEQLKHQRSMMEAIPRAANKSKLVSQKKISDSKNEIYDKPLYNEQTLLINLEEATAEVNNNIQLRKQGLINLAERYNEGVRQFHAEYDQFDSESEQKRVKAQDAVNEEDAAYEANMTRLNTALMKATEGEPCDDMLHMTVPSQQLNILKPGTAIISSETFNQDVVEKHIQDCPGILGSGASREMIALFCQSFGKLVEQHGHIIPEPAAPPAKRVTGTPQRAPTGQERDELNKAAAGLATERSLTGMLVGRHPNRKAEGPAEQHTRILAETAQHNQLAHEQEEYARENAIVMEQEELRRQAQISQEQILIKMRQDQDNQELKDDKERWPGNKQLNAAAEGESGPADTEEIKKKSKLGETLKNKLKTSVTAYGKKATLAKQKVEAEAQRAFIHS